MHIERNELRFFFLLIAVIAFGIIAFESFSRYGPSAVFIAISSIFFLLVFQLFARIRKSERSFRSTLRAISNFDSSLGFAQGDRLNKDISLLRRQFLESRENLKRQTDLLRSLLAHLNVGIIAVDHTGKVTLKNPAAERLLRRRIPTSTDDDFWSTWNSVLHAQNDEGHLIAPWKSGDDEDTFSIRYTTVIFSSNRIRIISFQSIHSALESEQQKAFKNLIRVLTHEVANSIMPISSLSQTLKTLIEQNQVVENNDLKSDLTTALDTMARRSCHLNEFIGRFSKISRLPSPNRRKIDLAEIIQSVCLLFQTTFKESEIEIRVQTSGSSFIAMVDPAQIEQVLINLIQNSVDALSGASKKIITINLGFNFNKQACIDIVDSGPGINVDAHKNIFIPFFTTKANGSGIGLSLARQIMMQNGGSLVFLNSNESSETLCGAHFRLIFK